MQSVAWYGLLNLYLLCCAPCDAGSSCDSTGWMQPLTLVWRPSGRVSMLTSWLSHQRSRWVNPVTLRTWSFTGLFTLQSASLSVSLTFQGPCQTSGCTYKRNRSIGLGNDLNFSFTFVRSARAYGIYSWLAGGPWLSAPQVEPRATSPSHLGSEQAPSLGRPCSGHTKFLCCRTVLWSLLSSSSNWAAYFVFAIWVSSLFTLHPSSRWHWTKVPSDSGNHLGVGACLAGSVFALYRLRSGLGQNRSRGGLDTRRCIFGV